MKERWIKETCFGVDIFFCFLFCFVLFCFVLFLLGLPPGTTTTVAPLPTNKHNQYPTNKPFSVEKNSALKRAKNYGKKIN